MKSHFVLPWVRGPQVDTNHSPHILLFVVVVGKHSAGHQQYNPQQLHPYFFFMVLGSTEKSAESKWAVRKRGLAFMTS